MHFLKITAVIITSSLSLSLSTTVNAEPPACPCWEMMEQKNSAGRVLYRDDKESPIMDLYVGTAKNRAKINALAHGLLSGSETKCEYTTKGKNWKKTIWIDDKRFLSVTHDGKKNSCEGPDVSVKGLTEMQAVGCAQELNEVFGIKKDGTYKTVGQCFSPTAPE